MLRAFFEFIGKLTAGAADKIHVPVGIFRATVTACLVWLFTKNFGAAAGFGFGVLYAIYVHNAISLRSVATRVIESTVVEALLTAVWTVGGWSWAEHRANNYEYDKTAERFFRLLGTWLALFALVPFFFGIKAAMVFGGSVGAVIALNIIIYDLNQDDHPPENLSWCALAVIVGIVAALVVGWCVSWIPFVGYHGVAHMAFSRIFFPVFASFIGFVTVLPLCEHVTRAVTSFLGYEGEIKGWRGVVTKKSSKPETVVVAAVAADDTAPAEQH